MNRAIKFRGKSIFGIHEWIYGSLLLLDGKTYILPNEVDLRTIIRYEVIPKTVGQFTGLFDNNERKIYDGDIIRGTVFTYEVGYSEESSCFTAKIIEPINDMTNYLGVYDTSKLNVLGNIYDNPELIKEDEPCQK